MYPPIEYSVTFLGRVGVGKTTIIDQLVSSDHNNAFGNNPQSYNDNQTR